jgi:hypothetical protein
VLRVFVNVCFMLGGTLTSVSKWNGTLRLVHDAAACYQ